MLEMVEVVGISEKGFSEAAREAVEKVAQEGKKIHFFKVIEQRGAVREGKIKEYQAIVKIAFEK